MAISKITEQKSHIFTLDDHSTTDPKQAIKNNISEIISRSAFMPIVFKIITNRYTYSCVGFFADGYSSCLIIGYSDDELIFLRQFDGTWYAKNIGGGVLKALYFKAFRRSEGWCLA